MSTLGPGLLLLAAAAAVSVACAWLPSPRARAVTSGVLTSVVGVGGLLAGVAALLGSAA